MTPQMWLTAASLVLAVAGTTFGIIMGFQGLLGIAALLGIVRKELS